MDDTKHLGVAAPTEPPPAIEHFDSDITQIILTHSFSAQNYTYPIDIVVPETITELWDEAFFNCSALRSIKFLGKMTTLGRQTFHGCKNMKEIELPDGLTTIEAGLFEGCEKLREIKLPDSITEIKFLDDNWAIHGPFAGCKNLKTITLPKGVRKIGARVFENCESLERVEHLGPLTLSEEHGEIFRGAKLAWIDPPCTFSSSEIRINSVIHYCKLLLSGKANPEYAKKYRRYLKSQRKRLYALALQNETILGTMIQENMIAREEIDDLLENADTTAKAMLLDYQNKLIPLEDRFQEQADEVDAAIIGIYSITLAKKYWSFQNIDQNRVRIKGYLGKEANIIVPLGIGNREVTEISKNAFSPKAPQILRSVADRRKNIETVILPEGLTEISDRLFYLCSNLKEIAIPEGVTKIGAGAFSCCHALAKITLPSTLKEIGCRAFESCSCLKHITLPTGLTNLGDYVFQDCDSLLDLGLPESVNQIGCCAFENCTSLQKMKLPEKITSINRELFSGCTAIEQIIIPNSVVEIENYAFAGCNRLTNLHLPDSIKKIGNGAFSNCLNLKSLWIPDSVEQIGESAFYECKSLREIRLPKSIIEIARNTFSNCHSLQTITIPENIRIIETGAFSFCETLNSVYFYDTISVIGSEAFLRCENLTNFIIMKTVQIPSQILGPLIVHHGRMTFTIKKRIEWDAFSGCCGLETLRIPMGIEILDSDIFESCCSLKHVYISKAVTEIGDETFSGCPGIAIHAPAGSYAETYAKEHNIPFVAE